MIKRVLNNRKPKIDVWSQTPVNPLDSAEKAKAHAKKRYPWEPGVDSRIVMLDAEPVRQQLTGVQFMTPQEAARVVVPPEGHERMCECVFCRVARGPNG